MESGVGLKRCSDHLVLLLFSDTNMEALKGRGSALAEVAPQSGRQPAKALSAAQQQDEFGPVRRNTRPGQVRLVPHSKC